MQDNRFDELEGPFMDQAWEEMRRLLDQEMPLTEKRRRGWLWLWLLLLLGGIAGGLWLFSRLEQKQERKGEDPVAILEYPTASPATARGDSEAHTSIPIEPGNSTTRKAATTGQADPSRSASVAVSGKGRGFQAPAPPGGNQEPDQVNQLIADPAPAVVNSRAEAVRTEDQLPAIGPPVSPAETPPGLHLVYSPPMATLNSLLPQPLSGSLLQTEPSLTGRDRKGRIRLGIEGGVLTSLAEPAYGWSGGVGVHYQPARGRWAVVSGLYWQRAGNRMLFDSDQSVTLSLAQYDQSIFPESFQVNSSSVEGQYFAELDRTDYLTFPLLAAYRLTPDLQLESGLQLAYLAGHQKTAGYEVMFEDAMPPNSVSGQQRSFVLADNDFSGLPIRRFDVAFSGGLGFYPGERWGLRLHYNHGLVSPLEASGGAVFNRQLRFSVIYFPVRNH